jgi:hypothetical protein
MQHGGVQSYTALGANYTVITRVRKRRTNELTSNVRFLFVCLINGLFLTAKGRESRSARSS